MFSWFKLFPAALLLCASALLSIFHPHVSLNHQEEETLLEPSIEERPAFQAAGVLNRGQPAELNFNQIWSEQYMPLDEAIRTFSPDKGYYGIWFYPEEEQAYLAGMAVEGMDTPPEGAVLREVPARTYAVFPCTISTIPQTYKLAFDEWLPESEYAFDDSGSDYEYYPPGSETAEAVAYVCVPLKKKA